MKHLASDADMTVAYPCLESVEEELPTVLLPVEQPSLIAIPSWPPKKKLADPSAKRPTRNTGRPVEVFPRQSSVAFEPPTFIHRAPHELSPFGGSARRFGASRMAVLAAIGFLGLSAFWAAYSVTHYL